MDRWDWEDVPYDFRTADAHLLRRTAHAVKLKEILPFLKAKMSGGGLSNEGTFIFEKAVTRSLTTGFLGDLA